MINQSVLAMEEGRMILPKEEDASHRLIDQMRNYTVKSITSRGDFTYEGEDHVLDAFHLAIYGFYHQYGVLLKTSYEHKIRFMRNPILDSYNNNKQDFTTSSPISNNNTMNNVVDPDKPKFNKPVAIGTNKNSRNSNIFGRGFRRLI